MRASDEVTVFEGRLLDAIEVRDLLGRGGISAWLIEMPVTSCVEGAFNVQVELFAAVRIARRDHAWAEMQLPRR